MEAATFAPLADCLLPDWRLVAFEVEDGSGYHFAILSRHQSAALKVATHRP
jgi:hypothetical protein